MIMKKMLEKLAELRYLTGVTLIPVSGVREILLRKMSALKRSEIKERRDSRRRIGALRIIR